MYDYYCKNCNNVVGKWNYKYTYIKYIFCKVIKSKNFNTIYFLDCENCNKFVGISCNEVCENCFGENEIYEEETLFNWFLIYKKINQKKLDYCKICNNEFNFRWQFWFFEELTFLK